MVDRAVFLMLVLLKKTKKNFTPLLTMDYRPLTNLYA